LVYPSTARQKSCQYLHAAKNPYQYSTVSQNFPHRVLEACRRYKYDEGLRNDPIEYQKIYQELKVEAALVIVISTKLVFAVYAEV